MIVKRLLAASSLFFAADPIGYDNGLFDIVIGAFYPGETFLSNGSPISTIAFAYSDFNSK